MSQAGYAFVVRCTVDPARRDAFVEAVNRHAARALREEPETLRFDVAIDESDSSRVYLYEAYANETAFQKHFASTQAGAQPWRAYVTAAPERLCIGTVVPQP